MNVLLAGGSGSLMEEMIQKVYKEGHRIYVLTGNRFNGDEYSRKVFEKYPFPYDSESLGDIFDSINPDVVVFFGAYDSNYSWELPKKESVRFYAGLSNLLVNFAQRGKGRFVFLSSSEVYSGNYSQEIEESEPTTASGFRAIALAQGEDMCERYRKNQDLDIVTLRLDHLYAIPESRKDIKSLCERMCLQALENKEIHIKTKDEFAMLYQADAVEAIYKLIGCRTHEQSIYNVSGNRVVTEMYIAETIQEAMGKEITIIDDTQVEGCWRVLSKEVFREEFRFNAIHSEDAVIKKIASHMKKNRWKFQSGYGKKPFWDRVSEGLSNFIRVILPYVENIVAFIPFFMLNNRTVGSAYFANLDFFLLYVLLFAIVHGQLQATLSAALAVAGYVFRQMYSRSGLEVLLDYNTYVWVAQLFILGLVVGYLKDQLRLIKGEQDQEIYFLSEQLGDIQDINSSNVRMKQVMETEIVNQNDSVGTIYSITAQLDQYVPEEVLFYAADMITQLMDSKDVAIYTVSGGGYARLMSATSKKARSLGNSLKYTELEDVCNALNEKKVFINRTLDERYPLMANAIYSEDNIQLIIMIWEIPWEKMTLGNANRLVVISYLIQNAVMRANRHFAELEYKRYKEGTQILEPDAFYTLVQAYTKARARGLTECSILQIEVPEAEIEQAAEALRKKMRNTDYMGILKDRGLFVLLANSDNESANFVIRKFAEVGYQSRIQEGIAE